MASDCVKSDVTLPEGLVLEELEEPSVSELALYWLDENVSKVGEVVYSASDRVSEVVDPSITGLLVDEVGIVEYR